MQSNDSAATEHIAELLAKNLRGNETIELISDLGGGKTTFVRGLVRGTGSSSHVSSPTFKISNTYKAPHFEIVHYDFYRLNDAGLMRHELADVIDDPKTVIVVEWAVIIHDILPSQRVTVRLKTLDEQSRSIEITVPAPLAYLLDGVKT